MKKTKFAVLFTALVAMLVLSSCLGEPDPYNYGGGIFKTEGFFGYYKFSDAYGTTVTPVNQSIITNTLQDGDFAYLYYRYDTRTITDETTNVDVELQQEPYQVKTVGSYESEGNAPFVSYNGNKEISFTGYLYDKYSLFVYLTYNVRYNTKDTSKNDLNYHNFNIWKVEEESSSDELVLRLAHNVIDMEIENEGVQSNMDIYRIDLSQYLYGEASTPNKITIKYQVENNTSLPEGEEGSQLVDVKEPFTLDYGTYVTYFPNSDK